MVNWGFLVGGPESGRKASGGGEATKRQGDERFQGGKEDSKTLKNGWTERQRREPGQGTGIGLHVFSGWGANRDLKKKNWGKD